MLLPVIAATSRYSKPSFNSSRLLVVEQVHRWFMHEVRGALVVQLHPLGPDDAPTLSRWAATYYAHEGLTFHARVTAGIGELLAHPEWGTAFEIRQDEEAIGYAVVTFGFDYEAGGRIGVLTDFYLVQDARGQGVGTDVIRLLEKWGSDRGLQALELVVLHHNPRARAFYERLGFKQPSDRLTLAKHLTKG